MGTEAEIQKDKRALRVEMKEAEVAQEDFIRMLKLEQDQRILDLRQEFDRMARDMQQKYELRMKTIREDMEKQRRRQVQKIEEAKTAHVQKVMAKNQKDFLEIKVYYLRSLLPILILSSGSRKSIRILRSARTPTPS